MTTPRETGVKRRAKEPPAGDAFISSSIETFRQRADAVLVSIDDVMRGEDPGRFEEARARAAQALEQYEKAAEKCEEHGSVCGDCREFFDETIVAALRMKNRVLLLELDDLKKRHAAEIEQLKSKHEGERGDLRVQISEFQVAFNVAQMHQAKSTLQGLPLKSLQEDHLRELKAQLEETLEKVSRAHAETSKPPGLEERAGPAPAAGK